MRASRVAWLAVVACSALIACQSATPSPSPSASPSPSPSPTPSPSASASPSPAPEHLTHVTIKALGMTCEESCPMRVRYALADIDAVYELAFDLDHEAIFVSYDSTLGAPKQVTKPMLDAIRSAGFDPWLAREDWPSNVERIERPTHARHEITSSH